VGNLLRATGLDGLAGAGGAPGGLVRAIDG
jgi:hypothetical protein